MIIPDVELLKYANEVREVLTQLLQNVPPMAISIIVIAAAAQIAIDGVKRLIMMAIGFSIAAAFLGITATPISGCTF